MPVIPSSLPLWAYAAALGGGFAVAKIGASAGGAAVAPAGEDAGEGQEPAAGSSSGTGLWDSWGDGGGVFGGSQGIGVLPAPYLGPGMDDYTDAPPVTTTPPPVTIPPIVVTPTPTPTPTPSPTPTVLYWDRPPGSPPAGAVGWVHLPPPQNVYDVASGYGDDGQILRLRAIRPLDVAGSRWVKAPTNAIQANGERIRARQFSRVNGGDWSLRNFYKDGATPVYSLSTARVRR